MEKMQSALVLVRVLLGFLLIEKGGFKRIKMNNINPMISLCLAYSFVRIILHLAMQQIQPAYIRQGSTGCLNVPVFGVDLSNTFVVSIVFKGTVLVCTTSRIIDGFSPLVVVDDRYKGRVSCGVDDGLNQISVCFTSAVYLDDGGRYFASTSTTSNNTLYVMGKF